MNRCEEDFFHVLVALWSAFDHVQVPGKLTRIEMHVCYILYYCKKFCDREPLTLTYISKVSHMPKSQINRTLISLEKRGFITRERSSTDRRRINVWLSEAGYETFYTQYEKHINLTNGLAKQLGPEKSRQLTELLTESLDIVTQDYFECILQEGKLRF